MLRWRFTYTIIRFMHVRTLFSHLVRIPYCTCMYLFFIITKHARQFSTGCSCLYCVFASIRIRSSGFAYVAPVHCTKAQKYNEKKEGISRKNPTKVRTRRVSKHCRCGLSVFLQIQPSAGSPPLTLPLLPLSRLSHSSKPMLARNVNYMLMLWSIKYTNNIFDVFRYCEAREAKYVNSKFRIFPIKYSRGSGNLLFMGNKSVIPFRVENEICATKKTKGENLLRLHFYNASIVGQKKHRAKKLQISGINNYFGNGKKIRRSNQTFEPQSATAD